MRVHLSLLLLGLSFALGLAACSQTPAPSVVTWQEIAAQPVPPADRRISYGSGPLQLGDLRLPEGPGRYDQASPIELLPMGARYRLLHGAMDEIVPVEQSRRFEKETRAAGADVQLQVLENAGHFDPIAPFAPEWQAVRQTVRSLLFDE